MSNFEDLNFYEMLEISVDASPFTIKRAYRNAVALYSKESLLTYSLFSEEERTAILRKIVDAYNTLIDKSKRKAYDTSLSNKSNS